MSWKRGVSVLIPTRNEEATAALCIQSFLPFGDELIVVDNGSTDHTKEIVRKLARQHPDKIRFFDRPDLPDLQHNRAFALRHARYEWIMRCDSDYVAYNEGPNDIAGLREFLLSRPRSVMPEVYAVPQRNLVLDFFHTGKDGELGEELPEINYTPRPVEPPQRRFYRRFPGFAFVRLGKREGVRWQRWLPVKEIDRPYWVQCSLKPDRNFLLRALRTEWRNLNDYQQYPTVESYLQTVIEQRYGTTDCDEAASMHMRQNFYPWLQPHDESRHFALPRLILEQRRKWPMYRLMETSDGLTRTYDGVDPDWLDAPGGEE